MSYLRLAAVALASAMAVGSAAAFDLTITGYATDDNSLSVQLQPDPITNLAWSGSAGVSELKLSLSGSGVPAGSIFGYTYRAELGNGTFAANGYQPETFQTMTTYSNEYSVVNFSAAKTNLLNKLFSMHGNDVQAATSSDAKNLAANAMQLAVWEVIYDNATEVRPSLATSGVFSSLASGSGARTTADNWLAAAATYTGPILFHVADLVSTQTTVIKNTGTDEHPVYTPTAAPGHTDFLLVTSVPEPSAMLLMTTGVFALGFLGRRRMRNRV